MLGPFALEKSKRSWCCTRREWYLDALDEIRRRIVFAMRDNYRTEYVRQVVSVVFSRPSEIEAGGRLGFSATHTAIDYNDVLIVQAGGNDGMIYKELKNSTNTYASNIKPAGTTNKINAIMGQESIWIIPRTVADV